MEGNDNRLGPKPLLSTTLFALVVLSSNDEEMEEVD